MSIKSFAFELQQAHPQVKRTQCYELIAAAFGYRSYSSINTQEILFLSVNEPPVINHTLVRDRAEQMGLNATLLLPKLASLLTSYPVTPYDLRKLAHQLELSPDSYSEVLINQLLSGAKSGSAYASYCVALICESKIDQPAPSDYWYKQQQSGALLTGTTIEFAEEYLEHVRAVKLYEEHMLIAAKAGVAGALVSLMNFSDDRLLQLTVSPKTTEFLWEQNGLSELAELCRSNREDGHTMLKSIEAAAMGDVGAIEDLARNLMESKPLLTSSLIHFAELLGADLTHGYAKAIDEDGNDYDDDIGGNAYVAEYEGIKAPELTIEEQDFANERASTWLLQLNAEGKADLKLF